MLAADEKSQTPLEYTRHIPKTSPIGPRPTPFWNGSPVLCTLINVRTDSSCYSGIFLPARQHRPFVFRLLLYEFFIRSVCTECRWKEYPSLSTSYLLSAPSLSVTLLHQSSAPNRTLSIHSWTRTEASPVPLLSSAILHCSYFVWNIHYFTRRGAQFSGHCSGSLKCNRMQSSAYKN